MLTVRRRDVAESWRWGMTATEDLLDAPLGVSPYRYPTGWYIMAWSTDVAAGQVKPVHYFGRDMVCFRTASGELSVLDAYCQHLGGNLGVGGKVEGDDIVCPWHGWHWRGDGTNSLIPYSREICKQNVRIR